MKHNQFTETVLVVILIGLILLCWNLLHDKGIDQAKLQVIYKDF